MKRRDPTPEEIALWEAHAGADARGKRAGKPKAPEAAPKPAPPRGPNHPPHPPVPAPVPAAPDLHAGDLTRMDRRTAERLKRETPDATLDLHGMRREEAQAAFHAFVQRQHANGARRLRIITGKGANGEGVLRGLLPSWVNDPAVRGLILGYDTAHARQGGSGAFTLLLKRKRET
jgi:DNA-nicking Smr family endonuclease